MNDSSATPQSEPRPWPHRVGMALVTVVFPLIWVGGLVTTTDAGMAVPDWPGTYGYNLFLYPISEWFFGPWDLFVEHGHRLLGSLAGILAITLVIVSWRQEPRRTVRWLAVSILGLVILQGVLGGVRVLKDLRWMAQIHGCVGPFFFATCVVFCVVTSRWWHQAQPSPPTRRLVAWAGGGLLVSFLQLVLGTFLRHIPVAASPEPFRWLVMAHVTVAVVLVLGTSAYWFLTRGRWTRGLGIRPSINTLVVLILIQFGLGLATWVVKYGWPVWFEDQIWAATFVISEKTRGQVYTVNAHVAVGSLILAYWTVQFFRVARIARAAGGSAGQPEWNEPAGMVGSPS